MESNFLYSSYREKAIEMIFIGDCLRRLWARGVYEVEVLRTDVDAAGYDVVMEIKGIVRHIQLKASFNGSTVRQQIINGKLAEKLSGCVIWIGFEPTTLELSPFYWFGAAPGYPLPKLDDFKKAKHTKGNTLGVKTERRNSFVLKRSKCEAVQSLDGILQKLFGNRVP